MLISGWSLGKKVNNKELSLKSGGCGNGPVIINIRFVCF